MLKLVVTAMLGVAAQANDGYRYLASNDLVFEEHQENSVVVGTTIGSCYSPSYTYYTSFQCETLKANCF